MLSATFPLVLHKNSPWNRNTHIGFSDDESKKHSWGGGNQKRAQRGSTWNTSQTQDIQKYSILVFCNFCSHSADRGRKSGRNTKLPSKATSVSSCFNISVQTSVLGQSSGIHSWPSRRWLSHRVFTSMFTYSCSILLSLVRVLLLTNQGHWGTKDIFTYAKTEKQSETKLLCIFHGKLLENVLL